MSVTIEVDPRQQAAIESALANEPHIAYSALRRTVTKVLNSVRSQGLRAIAKAHDIPLASLRRRRRASVAVKITREEMRGTAWFGTVPVKAGYLGKAYQTPAGARVGRHRFDGAFVATLASGHIGIFRRAAKGSRWTSGRPHTSSANLPIVEQVVELKAAASALAPIAAGLADQVEKVFQQELNFERVRRK